MPSRSVIIILSTFCLALLLTVLPLPEWARAYRPQWVSLVLIYWCIALPHRVGVGAGFSIGIVLDALTSTLFGQHALGMSLTAFLAGQLHARIRVFPLWQQALVILIFLLAEHLLTLWVVMATSQTSPNPHYWSIPIIGAILWPWAFMTLRNVRRKFNVA
jgi:rod shape-determining protein MreD